MTAAGSPRAARRAASSIVAVPYLRAAAVLSAPGLSPNSQALVAGSTSCRPHEGVVWGKKPTLGESQIAVELVLNNDGNPFRSGLL